MGAARFPILDNQRSIYLVLLTCKWRDLMINDLKLHPVFKTNTTSLILKSNRKAHGTDTFTPIRAVLFR